MRPPPARSHDQVQALPLYETTKEAKLDHLHDRLQPIVHIRAADDEDSTAPHTLLTWRSNSSGSDEDERWEEEDSNLPIASTSNYASPLEPPPLLRTRPEMLTEDASGAENVFLGPLSERLVAALAFQEEGEESDEDAQDAERLKDEQRFKKQQGMDGALVDRRGQMDAVELEERIKRELRFIGILPDEDVRPVSPTLLFFFDSLIFHTGRLDSTRRRRSLVSSPRLPTRAAPSNGAERVSQGHPHLDRQRSHGLPRLRDDARRSVAHHRKWLDQEAAVWQEERQGQGPG